MLHSIIKVDKISVEYLKCTEGPIDKPHIYDNRRLAALFGLDPSLGYTTKKLHGQPKFEVLVKFFPLH